jgi:hypothetical protein
MICDGEMAAFSSAAEENDHFCGLGQVRYARPLEGSAYGDSVKSGVAVGPR